MGDIYDIPPQRHQSVRATVSSPSQKLAAAEVSKRGRAEGIGGHGCFGVGSVERSLNHARKSTPGLNINSYRHRQIIDEKMKKRVTNNSFRSRVGTYTKNGWNMHKEKK